MQRFSGLDELLTLAGTLSGPEATGVSSSRLQTLFDVDPAARAAYDGRADISDPSDSGQDLSLATRAASMGWKRGEIHWLIRDARAKRGAKEKHGAYFDRTVEKAMNASPSERSDEALRSILGVSAATVPADVPVVDKLLAISEALGLVPVITRIVETRAEPVTYRMHWNDTFVDLGTPKDLQEQTAFRSKMMVMARRVVPRMKGERWDAILQMMIDVAEIVEVGAEGTMSGLIGGWIENYVGDMATDRTPTPNWQIQAYERGPYRDDDGVLWISTQKDRGLAAHIRALEHQTIAPTLLAATLKQRGWTYVEKTIRMKDKVFSRGLWREK